MPVADRSQAIETSEPDYIEAAIQVIQDAEAARTIGRPSVITPQVVRDLCRAFEWGAFPDAACRYARVSYDTYKRWMDQGREDIEAGKLDTASAAFCGAMGYASAKDEVEGGRYVQEAGRSNPRFYMAEVIRLSRRYRERWAERTADELRAATVPSVQVLIGIAPPGTPQNPIVQVIESRPALQPSGLSPTDSPDLHRLTVEPHASSVA